MFDVQGFPKKKQAGKVLVRSLGRVLYGHIFRKMKEFTLQRDALTPDEIWIVEHEPVFTLGQAAVRSHILDAHGIPVIETDRGGEVTYHGPGQAVVYLMFDLRRRYGKLHVRELVSRIESAVISVLETVGITGERRAGAPGVYIPAESSYGTHQRSKIAALGLKIRSNGCMYHGLALNVAMNLEPFRWIDPCGYKGLAVTDMKSLGFCGGLKEVQLELLHSLSRELDFKVMFVGDEEVNDAGQ